MALSDSISSPRRGNVTNMLGIEYIRGDIIMLRDGATLPLNSIMDYVNHAELRDDCANSHTYDKKLLDNLACMFRFLARMTDSDVCWGRFIASSLAAVISAPWIVNSVEMAHPRCSVSAAFASATNQSHIIRSVVFGCAAVEHSMPSKWIPTRHHGFIAGPGRG